MKYNNKSLPTKVIVANTEWQKFLDVAKAEYIAAGQAYDVAINDANATMESLISADTAKTAAGAKWEAAQATANRMAADARMATADVVIEEVAEVVAEVISWESALSTAKQTFAVAKSAYIATMSNDDATTEELTTAAHAYDAASAEWVIAQATANRTAAHA
jgi:hypothetical protein